MPSIYFGKVLELFGGPVRSVFDNFSSSFPKMAQFMRDSSILWYSEIVPQSLSGNVHFSPESAKNVKKVLRF